MQIKIDFECPYFDEKTLFALTLDDLDFFTQMQMKSIN